jgi:2-polyprenyl-6-methoxyphenol hydroxylase-like FAD-dependent oxidoreductase
MSTSPPIDVLVVGAGPVGLTMAASAVQHGLRCRLIDQNAGPTVHSKAQVVHARTLEALDRMGAARALVARGLPLHELSVLAERGQKRVIHFQIDGLDSPYPFMLSIPQHDTEVVLAEHLSSLGGRAERQVHLDSFEQDEAGVTAYLTHMAIGASETVRARWLVGCDGAHSTVRHGLGLEFAGSTYELRLIQADLHLELGRPIARDEVVAFLAPARAAAFFPLPAEGRYRMLVPLSADDPLAQVEGDAMPQPVLADFQRVLEEVGPAGATVSDPNWMVGFRIHCRRVTKYRDRRVFVAGDAAHIHSPAGGQGMNTGIQDAFNLAWKLALVVHGQAPATLLDSYEAERLPVARAVLASTDTATRNLGSGLLTRNPLAIGVRNHLVGLVANLGLVQRRVSRALSQLEVAYPDSPIIGEDRPGMLGTRLIGSATSEAPSLASWVDFGHGPGPGERAPDVHLDPEHEDGPRLFASLSPTAHTLLLFDGAAATAEGYANLGTIAARTKERYGTRVATAAVVPAASRPAALDPAVTVLLDAAGEVHRRYGARSECLYLVRPDGVVAFRGQPADGDKLQAFLERIFT